MKFIGDINLVFAVILVAVSYGIIFCAVRRIFPKMVTPRVTLIIAAITVTLILIGSRFITVSGHLIVADMF